MIVLYFNMQIPKGSFIQTRDTTHTFGTRVQAQGLRGVAPRTFIPQPVLALKGFLLFSEELSTENGSFRSPSQPLARLA